MEAGLLDRPQLSPEQRERLTRMLEAQTVDRFRRGVLGAIAGATIVLGMALRTFPGERRILSGGFAVVVLLTTVARVLVGRPSLRRHTNAVLRALGTLNIVALAVMSARTGGFASPILPALFVVWGFGVVLSQMPAREFLILAFVQLGLLIALLYRLSPVPGSPGVFLAIAFLFAAVSALGGYLREQAQIRVFLASEALDAANRQLAHKERALIEVNEDLEQRVAEKVRERSRELAEALRRLSDHGDAGVLGSGDVVGGRVEIVRQLGHGGMGAVYLGKDLATGRRVAVKLMRSGSGRDFQQLRRFLAEAEAAAAISHPAVVRPLHVDVTPDGRIYHILEYAEGVSLDRRLEQGAVESGAAARLGAALADALAAAHAIGVIHRDVKPANVMLSTAPPGLRVLDFGLSKLVEDSASGAPGLTETHQRMGTPAYMSPEQIRDAAHVTVKTDVYSLGVTLHEMLAGRLPFLVPNVPGLYQAHLEQPPPPLERNAPTVSPDLAHLVGRCLDKQPSARPTASEVAHRLTALADRLGAPDVTAVAARELAALSDSEGANAATLPHPAQGS